MSQSYELVDRHGRASLTFLKLPSGGWSVTCRGGPTVVVTWVDLRVLLRRISKEVSL